MRSQNFSNFLMTSLLIALFLCSSQNESSGENSEENDESKTTIGAETTVPTLKADHSHQEEFLVTSTLQNVATTTTKMKTPLTPSEESHVPTISNTPALKLKTSTFAPKTTKMAAVLTTPEKNPSVSTTTITASTADMDIQEKGDPITNQDIIHSTSTSSKLPAKLQPLSDSDSSFTYSASQMFVLLVLCAFFVVGLAYLFYSRVIVQLQKRRKSAAVFKTLVEENDDDSSYMRLTALEPIDTQDDLMDDCDSVEILIPGNEDTDCYLRKTSPTDDGYKIYKNSQVAGVKLNSADDDMLLFEI